MGPPGSGKGTQAELLARRFGYEHVSTGHLLRNLIKDFKASPKEREEAMKIQKGHMAADWLIFELVFASIEWALKEKKGIVLDGAVRTLKQAEGFGEFFSKLKLWGGVKAIWINLEEAEALRRAALRLICKQCGHSAIILKEKKRKRACDRCGGELVHRADDTPAIIHERFRKQGNEAQKPVLDYFRHRRALLTVDGKKSIPTVFQELLKHLK